MLLQLLEAPEALPLKAHGRCVAGWRVAGTVVLVYGASMKHFAVVFKFWDSMLEVHGRQGP